ncbi:MAG: hydroxymethylglutaryl-CoA reductase, degradative [Candidatus Poseidoniales archaeon]
MYMAVDNSRLKGFFQLSVEERRSILADIASLSAEDIASLESGGGLNSTTADTMIENVYTTMSLPVGVATNFIIDGKDFVIPFCLEESSVIAAASNMAKRCHQNGGFSTDVDESMMIGQIQLLGIKDLKSSSEAVQSRAQEIIDLCNSLPSTMVRLGGGCKRIRCRIIEDMLIVHIIVDCKDAMGANAVNTMAELCTPLVEEISGGEARLRIVSNLAIHRLARSTATFTPEEMSMDGSHESGLEVISRILDAYRFASIDPFRATTHNKGTMNAISSIALACGQDWRAVEASCHAWITHNQGRYGSITEWKQDEDGNLQGSIEIPLAVGIVGGAVSVHPVARANLSILGVESAAQLAGVMASAGLAQNLAAMRALATSGIQSGHMKLHVRNMAVSAGAMENEVEQVAKVANESGQRITQSLVDGILRSLRG